MKEHLYTDKSILNAKFERLIYEKSVRKGEASDEEQV